jgi:hypothetical protein
VGYPHSTQFSVIAIQGDYKARGSWLSNANTLENISKNDPMGSVHVRGIAPTGARGGVEEKAVIKRPGVGLAIHGRVAIA